MLKLKQADIAKVTNRADYQQVLALRNYDDNELSNLIDDELEIENKYGEEFKKMEKLER